LFNKKPLEAISSSSKHVSLSFTHIHTLSLFHAHTHTHFILFPFTDDIMKGLFRRRWDIITSQNCVLNPSWYPHTHTRTQTHTHRHIHAVAAQSNLAHRTRLITVFFLKNEHHIFLENGEDISNYFSITMNKNYTNFIQKYLNQLKLFL
jgi:hypothetical protein